MREHRSRQGRGRGDRHMLTLSTNGRCEWCESGNRNQRRQDGHPGREHRLDDGTTQRCTR
jgi:hypothetical protein